jgi:hypothetical protein
MNAAQKVAYQKKLARTREYIRERAEWLKLGDDPRFPTLQSYRNAKHNEPEIETSLEQKVRQYLQLKTELRSLFA